MNLTVNCQKKEIRKNKRDFPGGPVVKNLLYNAGDVDSVPVWRTKIPQAVGQLSRSSRALVQPNKWMNI